MSSRRPIHRVINSLILAGLVWIIPTLLAPALLVVAAAGGLALRVAALALISLNGLAVPGALAIEAALIISLLLPLPLTTGGTLAAIGLAAPKDVFAAEAALVLEALPFGRE